MQSKKLRLIIPGIISGIMVFGGVLASCASPAREVVEVEEIERTKEG